MDTAALAQFIPLLIWSALAVIPSLTICRRIGKTRWWSVLAIIPLLGPVVFAFIVAYSRWTVTPTYNLSLAQPEAWSASN